MPLISSNKTGVYSIRNVVTGKRYVGSASRSLVHRMRSHALSLSSGKHWNVLLQRAWNKYGPSNFKFEILERCRPEMCIDREQFWIDHFKSYNCRFGYNISPTAGSPRGVKHTQETRAKVSNALRGKPKSKEHTARIKEGKQNTKMSTRKKMSAYALCRTKSHLENLAAGMVGNTNGAGNRSEEFCKRASELAKARWQRWREEGRIQEIGNRIREGQRRSR